MAPLLDEELEFDELDVLLELDVELESPPLEVLLELLLEEELELDVPLELDEDELELLLLPDVLELPDDPDGSLESSGPDVPEPSLQAITEEIRAPTRRMRVNLKKRFILFAAGKDPCLIPTPVHGATTPNLR